jgi:tRNA U55 pseudouridine synthase TruB
LRNLIHDIGLRLRTYALCAHIRRISDGFASFDKHALVYTDWELDKLRNNIVEVTNLARENISKYDKTIVIGQTREELVKQLDEFRRVKENEKLVKNLNENAS